MASLLLISVPFGLFAKPLTAPSCISFVVSHPRNNDSLRVLLWQENHRFLSSSGKKESVNLDTVQYGHCDGLVLSAGESADRRTLMTVKGSLLLVNKQE